MMMYYPISIKESLRCRRYMKLQDSQYRPVDKSEEFLRKLTDQFISKFVILNIDLKGSTNLSQRMTLLSNSLMIVVTLEKWH